MQLLINAYKRESKRQNKGLTFKHSKPMQEHFSISAFLLFFYNFSSVFILILSSVLYVLVSPMIPLVEVLMITNQGYWLLMVNIELSDRLKFIKH